MSNIASINFHELTRPLKVAFATSLGSKNIIRSVIVKVNLDSGFSGIGECPTSFSMKQETIPAIKVILEASRRLLHNTPIAKYGFTIKELRIRHPLNPMTVSGIETALFRAHLADIGKSEYGYWGGAIENIETDITIPIIEDTRALDRWIDRAVKTGFSIFKLKTSGAVEADKVYLSRVYDKLKNDKENFIIRLDGNQGYTEKTFFRFVDFLQKKNYKIELFEQPLPKMDYAGLKEIKKRSSMPVILDETIFTSQDMMRSIEEDLGHGVNIKIAKSGISESGNIYSIAKAHNLRLMIGCMTETMAGLSAGIYFALGTGGFDYIDLDAVHFLRRRQQYGNIRIEGPRYVLADG
jgi:L-alanine-DL-glutamate epimerase-like enolase superfamily enzyme